MGLDWETRGVLADFRQCQTASQNTDLIFHCTNGHVSAHQIIFAGISPLFTNLMQRYVIGQELFPLDLNISLPEIRREHMEMVVEMVYTGQVRITKRDYQPFRAICQLLKLRVPIADYDNFFMNQSDEDRANSIQAQDPQVRVSIPRVLVCGECDAIFSLKIALVRHRRSKHGQNESRDSEPPPSPPIETEPSTFTPLNNIPPNKQRTLETSKRILETECIIEMEDEDVETDVKDMLEDESQPWDPPASTICSEPSTDPQLKTRPSRERSLARMKLILENEAISETEDNDIETEVENPLENESQTSSPPPSPIVSEPSTAPQLNTRPRRQRSLARMKLILENELFSETEDNDIETEVENTLENESQTSGPPPSPIVSETSTAPQLNTLPRRQRSSNSDRNLICPPNEKYGVKCPDCQKLCALKDVRKHLALHLRNQLNELLTKRNSRSGLFQCESCGHKTHCHSRMRTHMALGHNMIMKLANEAQTKFLDDAEKLILEGRHSNIMKLNNSRACSSIKNEKVKETSRLVKCPDCQRLIPRRWVRNHLVTHLRKHLIKLSTKSESEPKLLKCKVCPYETRYQRSMRFHLDSKHNVVMKYANEAQKKFLADAQTLLPHSRGKRTRRFYRY